ncbi:MAG: histidine ammonia-lyase [Actinobacteria bacterium]|nr:histidine ammonia-lyase [Actinomycetota bacterium]
MDEIDVIIDGTRLTAAQVVAVADRRATVRLADDLDARLAPARAVVDDALAAERIVYGVTTGFGALASTRISRAEAEALQVSLLRSHAAGVGDPLPPRIVRAMLLLRARTLSQGHSGVRPEVVRLLTALLARDLLPVVPEQGSVGASGDLQPFAHLALPLIGEGSVMDGGELRAAADALADHGLEPLRLHAKEGLSLLNGTEGMLALGVLAAHRIRRLAVAADIAVALSIEALMGSVRPFDPRVHDLRPHPGQSDVAANVRRLLDGSPIVASHHHDFEHAVQDAYSLRCAPQVHGSVRDVIAYGDAVFERELGAVVDNPIVFPDRGEVISAGNFHGQPLAFALDFLTIAATELGSISERRTDRVLDPERSNGLPPFLAARPGVNSGYMLTQYTAAALVAENRVLSHPASVESIPTSGSQEDHVSMGWGAARKLRTVLDNTARVLAVELLCAAEGLRYREPGSATGTNAALTAIRSVVEPLTDDRVISDDIENIARLIDDGALEAAVGAAVGALR